MRQLAANIYRFYADGFRQMTIGRKLWALILIKLAIIFLVFKLFFFPDILAERYDTDTERADAVRRALAADSTAAPETADTTTNN